MRTDRREAGFTLIEVLVVVAIIAILAAIAFSTLLSQRTAAYRAAVISDLRASVIITDTFVDSAALYPADQAAFDEAISSNGALSPDVHLTYTLDGSGTSYTIVGCHDRLDATDDCTDGSVTPVVSWDSTVRLLG